MTTARETYGTELAATFVAKMDDPEWAHYEWRVTLTRDGLAGAGAGGKVTRTLPYKMGLGHVQTKCGKPIQSYRTMPCQHSRCESAGPQPTPPTLYDVLTGLKADATHDETFSDWCDSLGYDTDSRKALETYLACQDSENESRRFFGADWSRIVDDENYE